MKRFTAASRAALREVLRAEIIDGLRLLGRRATEESRAVDHGIDAAHRGRERIHLEQIALDQLDTSFAQVGGAHRIAHERAHLIAALGKSLGQSASDLSGRSGDEDFHVRNLAPGRRRRLEETDKRAPRACATVARATILVSCTRAAVHRNRIAPSASTASAVAALFVYDCDRDGPAVAIPRPEIQIVVRFGPSARNGLDVHAFGARQTVHRKLIRGGQRSVTARLQLGASDAVLGVPAPAIAGRIVALEDLWGAGRDAATVRSAGRRARHRRCGCHPGERDRRTPGDRGRAPRRARRLALAAADRLASANVNAVAADLGVSERHLRRVFRDTVGVSPKAFAKLDALPSRATAPRARTLTRSWASIAAAAGYYDQAHLIAEFRAIAGVTPRALLGELRTGRSIG